MVILCVINCQNSRDMENHNKTVYKHTQPIGLVYWSLDVQERDTSWQNECLYRRTVGVITDAWPGDDENPLRLKVVETFVWQRLLNCATCPRQQWSVCHTHRSTLLVRWWWWLSTCVAHYAERLYSYSTEHKS